MICLIFAHFGFKAQQWNYVLLMFFNLFGYRLYAPFNGKLYANNIIDFKEQKSEKVFENMENFR